MKIKKKKKINKETSVTGNVAGFAKPLAVYDVRKDANVIKRAKKKAMQNAIGRSKAEPRGWNYLENKMSLKKALEEEVKDLFTNKKWIVEHNHKGIIKFEDFDRKEFAIKRFEKLQDESYREQYKIYLPIIIWECNAIEAETEKNI